MTGSRFKTDNSDKKSERPPVNPEPRKRSGLHRRVNPLSEPPSSSRRNTKQVKSADPYTDLAKEITEFDRKREVHETRIRELLSTLSSAEINNLRYQLFAPHYDEHMEDHERAIDCLINQIIRIEQVGFRPPRQLIHDRILEMSCGTGTVIKILCEAIPQDKIRTLKFTANDLSEDMKSIAKQKLKVFPCSVEFTSDEIRALSFPPESFGTVILSQTLHLITDEDVVRQERESNYMHIDEKLHLDEKFKVIERAFSLIKDNGTLVIIDEWPALLSDRGGPLGPGFAYLFNDGLRAIPWATIQYSIMGRLPSSRFVAQIKVPIDKQHAMHLIAYQKDPDKLNHSTRLPYSPEFEAARISARDTVISAFRSIDEKFIRSVKPSGGGKPWVKFLSMDSGRLLHHQQGGITGVTEENKFNCIIISGRMHQLDNWDRYMMLHHAMDSLKLGGSLLIVDEWNAPKGSTNPIRKSAFQHLYMDRFSKNLIFAGALRVPIMPPYSSGMYGYQYRKVF